MNAPQNDTAPVSNVASQSSYKTLVSTLLQVGTTWAAHGLKVGKVALSMSAETLGRTANALDTLAANIEKKGGSAASATPPPAANEPASPAQTATR